MSFESTFFLSWFDDEKNQSYPLSGLFYSSLKDQGKQFLMLSNLKDEQKRAPSGKPCLRSRQLKVSKSLTNVINSKEWKSKLSIERDEPNLIDVKYTWKIDTSNLFHSESETELIKFIERDPVEKGNCLEKVRDKLGDFRCENPFF